MSALVTFQQVSLQNSQAGSRRFRKASDVIISAIEQLAVPA